jgi:hypothetical protein
MKTQRNKDMKKPRATHMRQRMRSLPAILAALLLLLPGVVSAQDLIGVRLSGGLSWNVGSGFANVGSNKDNVVQPEGTVAVTLNALPRLRAGLGYSYTRMVREQLDGTLEPIGGDVLPGSVEGTLYRDLKTHFHAVGVTAEYNLLPVGGILSLYAGTGVGCLFAMGNTWALTVRQETSSDGWTNRVTVGAHNEVHRYAAPYIPASLSLECRILPRTYLCLGGQYRFVLTKNPLSPKGQAGVTLGLRLAF